MTIEKNIMNQKNKKLTPEQIKTMEGGTEAPFTGEYVHTKEKGTYKCANCGVPLFSSDTKFDSGTGWPSFDEVIASDRIKRIHDTSHGMSRIEVRCGNCDAHLGHVFDDGPTSTGARYCINSACLELENT